MYDDIYNTYKKTSKNNINKELFNHSSKPTIDLVNDIKNNKIVIYTAFTSDYDSLKEPDFIDENCDYVCFTDNPEIKSDIWDIRLMEDSILDNNRKAKQYKVLTHKYLPEYKYSFWLDGTFKIKGSIREYIYNNIKNDSKILCVVHPERNCIYEEFKISKKIIRYPALIMEKQIKKYKDEGLPKNYGLAVLGAIFREHNSPEIIQMMNDWWKEIIEFSNQDQLSFCYAAWKNNIHPSVSKIYYWNNKYWQKEGEYHHKVLLKYPGISDNLIDNLKEKVKSSNQINLNKEELYTLINEIKGLSGHYEYLDKKIKDDDKEIDLILNSHSLKLTKVFRDISSKIKYNPYIYTIFRFKFKFKRILNVYNRIKSSEIFNEENYKIIHPNIKLNPILDYICFNHDESIKIKKEYIDEIFDFDFYINEYNFEKSIDPLIHYFLRGFYENNKINQEDEGFIKNISDNFHFQYEEWVEDKISEEINNNKFIHDSNILIPLIESKKLYNTNFKKIAIFLEDSYENINDYTYFRFYESFKKLSKKLHIFIYGIESSAIIDYNNFLNVKQFDTIIIQKTSPYLDIILKKAQEHDIKIIYDIDEDIINENSYFTNSIKNFYNNADAITVNTNYLKNKLKSNNVELIENPFPNHLLKFKHNENDTNFIKIGCIANFKNRKKLEEIKNIILKLKNEAIKKNIILTFEIFGDIEFNEKWIKNIKIPSYEMPIKAFYKWLDLNINWDIGIVLKNNKNFDRGISQLRYMELSALGSVMVINRFDGCDEFITDGYKGIIFDNNEELYEKLKQLIFDKNLRDNILNNARNDILKRYKLNDNVKAWNDILIKK